MHACLYVCMHAVQACMYAHAYPSDSTCNDRTFGAMIGRIGNGRATEAAKRSRSTEAARRAPGDSAAPGLAGHLSPISSRYIIIS